MMMIRKIAYLIAFSLIVLMIPSLGSFQTVTIGHYNVSIDFEGTNVTADPQSSSSDINTVTRSITFHSDSPGDWGSIYLVDQRAGKGMADEEMLWRAMNAVCKAPRINPGTVGGQSGLVGKGDARVEHGFGQECCGGVLSLPSGVGESHSFMIIGHFLNETLNKDIVRTVQIRDTDSKI